MYKNYSSFYFTSCNESNSSKSIKESNNNSFGLRNWKRFLLHSNLFFVVMFGVFEAVAQPMVKGNIVYSKDNIALACGEVYLCKSNWKTEVIFNQLTDTLGYFEFDMNNFLDINIDEVLVINLHCKWIGTYPTVIMNIPLNQQNVVMNNIPLFEREYYAPIVEWSSKKKKIIQTGIEVYPGDLDENNGNYIYNNEGDSVLFNFNKELERFEIGYKEFVKYGGELK